MTAPQPSQPADRPSGSSSPRFAPGFRPCVAIVGSTGAVGVEMISVLEQRRFPVGALRLFASPRSAGSVQSFNGAPITVEALGDTWHHASGNGPRVDIALLSAGSSISKQYAPRATADGVVIANPNCSTIIFLVAVTPIHRALGIERAVVSTYQAASGAGAQAMAELENQTRDVLAGKPAQPKIFHEPYAFNLFSHNSQIDPRTGLNVEESKMILETHKIWGDASVRISATCVRVPVLRAHCESVNLTLRTPTTVAKLRELLSSAPGVRIIDDRAANLHPTPLKASGGDDVLVGRLRADPSQLPADTDPAHADTTPTRGFDLFIAGDQLRKGAAQNAVQLAELALR
jgi:aspartate-semialdehyde dehydrogenase